MWNQIYSTEWTNLIAMIPLLLCSIITIAIIIERLITFRPSSMFNDVLVDQIVEDISSNNHAAALTRVEKQESLLEVLLFSGIKDRYENGVLAEVAFLDHGMSKLDILAKWIPTLSFIAKVAPLFGLLGTVLGMISAFEVLAGASEVAGSGVDPAAVANGIGTALLTTAVGLMVAIPALVTSSVLTRIGEGVYNKFEDAFRRITIAAGGLRSEIPETIEKS